MKYINYTFENGNIINVPEEFIALDNLPGEHLHYRVELIPYKYTPSWVFKVTHIDGDVPIEYAINPDWIIFFLPEVFLSKKIKPCTMKKFKAIRTFL